MDAYELLSKTSEIHLAEMVDPNYVIIAKKQFLAGRQKAELGLRPGAGRRVISVPYTKTS